MQLGGGLAGYLFAYALRLSRRPIGVAVVYHRVDAVTGDPRRELVPAHGARLFDRQLRHLKASYRVVPASELFAAVATRRRGQRIPVAITFDDDLSTHRRVAMPILERLGLHATFFLSGASLEGPFAFWWERLQRAFDQGIDVQRAMPASVGSAVSIVDVGVMLRSGTPAERNAAADELLAELGPDPPEAGIRADDVRALAAAGFEVGFHTRRHDALVELDDDQLKRALIDGRAELEAIVERKLAGVAYPYGIADERVAAVAAASGYAFGFTAAWGAVRSADNPMLMPRVEPPFTSAGHFALRVARLLVTRWRR
jgi:peptidoglycan/xylan/chitin deacetylase (PgdA/CDA1 family)